MVVGDCVPALTVLVRIEPELAARRGAQRWHPEPRTAATASRRGGWSSRPRWPPPTTNWPAGIRERIVVIDGDGEPGEVHERVMAAVAERR